MGMPNLAKTWTREQVLALPDDGNRYELVDGELLVSPAPRWVHQTGVKRLLFLLDPYVRPQSWHRHSIPGGPRSSGRPVGSA
ncbi:MAG: hypothetical protein EXR94_02235 [Gemmatimonadetes bacterium]|nr:hypothetical protein [Gemmatimonadota bacterium]